MAGDVEALGYVLSRLAHRVEAEAVPHPWIDEPPADARVEELRVAAEWLTGLRHDVRSARHALDSSSDVQIAVAQHHRARGDDGGAHPGCAEPVDCLAWYRLRETGEQSCHARDVA